MPCWYCIWGFYVKYESLIQLSTQMIDFFQLPSLTRVKSAPLPFEATLLPGETRAGALDNSWLLLSLRVCLDEMTSGHTAFPMDSR